MPKPIKQILMPTDFSDYSKDALDHAVQMAQVCGAEIHLLHVFETVFVSTAPEYIKFLEEFMEEETKKLKALAEEIQSQNVEVHMMFQQGTPHRQIVEAAREVQADLIVIGTHGRTGLSHAMIGSVAERVARISPCPVLIVRPKALQEKPNEIQGYW